MKKEKDKMSRKKDDALIALFENVKMSWEHLIEKTAAKTKRLFVLAEAAENTRYAAWCEKNRKKRMLKNGSGLTPGSFARA
jgi:hypothetical protein